MSHGPGLKEQRSRPCNTCSGVELLYYIKVSHHTCVTCFSKLTTKLNKKVNDKSLETATQHHQPWSRDEVNRLAKLVDKGMSNYDIAVELGRSASSIGHMKYRERIFKRKPFTAQPGDPIDMGFLRIKIMEMI